MHDLSAVSIKKIAIHKVGNKAHEEKLALSEDHLRSLAVEEEEILLRYFLKSFQHEEYCTFTHHTDLELNEAYSFINELYFTSINFMEASQRLAKHLYAHSIHPKVKGGEFYAVYFEGAVIDGEEVDALGLFKSEQKSMFMNIQPKSSNFDLSFEKGIDIKKLDKGCIVFNTKGAEGYRVLIHDAVSKGDEAAYWKDDFLGVEVMSTEFTKTRDYMELTRSFVMEEMPQAFDVDRTMQIQMMNRSSGYFTENDAIDTEEFTQTVLEQPEVIQTFTAYKERYASENNIEIEDHFDSSKSAVKQGKKFFKSVLKLDKNFHIYVHGSPDNIEQGYDAEKGMKFYKVFYNEEK
ncbi:MAG: nucleoid-associated protein [Flavobacteriales bacterium]|nr:nucleoid-associated protein [Flavobacteriales bacterium]